MLLGHEVQCEASSNEFMRLFLPSLMQVCGCVGDAFKGNLQPVPAVNLNKLNEVAPIIGVLARSQTVEAPVLRM